MSDGRLLGVDWPSWLDRWDAQQSGYIPDREARFTVMLDVLEVLLPPDFVAVDLGCGPGSLSKRLLDRFPRGRCLAVDLDPVLMAMGQHVHGTVGGRLAWIEADLRDADWPRRLEIGAVDAVLSTTALHWLASDELTRVYRQLGALVREGGVVLNGDTIRFGPSLPTFRRVAAVLEQRIRQHHHQERRIEDWENWWQALEAEPAVADLFAERHRRFAWRDSEPGKRFSARPTEGMTGPVIDLHEGALRNAGFREVGIIWQQLEDRVVMAIR